MNKKLKLALAALLGFSGACSSVKNAPKTSDPQQPAGVQVTPNDTLRRIVVMYGVRRPQPAEKTDSLRKPVNRHPSTMEVDPVAEQPKD